MSAGSGEGCEPIHDPEAAARAAHLRYVSPDQPGIRRHRRRGGFGYRNPDGSAVKDETTLGRIRALAIPPAYEDVWICRLPNGHLQAVGRDARGRKQYRYHPKWRLVRDESKFERMLVFGRVLPRVRERVAADLAHHGLPRERVLAAIVRLLEATRIRIGNEEYARTNRSFGLTTLRNRHVKTAGGHLAFDFRGKSGVAHHIELGDRRLARIVERCRDLSGQHLFQYLNEDGACHAIGSEDVNAYLRDISGEEITAKDFRTWAATRLAIRALRVLPQSDTKAGAKRNIVAVVAEVASLLGNTPAVCRKCYIHPAVLETYLEGSLFDRLNAPSDTLPALEDAGWSAEETAVLRFLEHHVT